MEYVISVRRKALLHILEHAERFESYRPGLGWEFSQSIDSALEDLKLNPLKYQLRYRNTRMVFMKRFNIAIHYLVEYNRIYIISVFHQKENPERWT